MAASLVGPMIGVPAHGCQLVAGPREAGVNRGWPETGARRIGRRGGPRHGPPHPPRSERRGKPVALLDHPRVGRFTGAREAGVNRGWPETGARRSIARRAAVVVESAPREAGGRAGEEAAMAVTALLHYALEVPDHGAGEKFYTSFGLVNASGRGDAVRLRPAPLQRESVLLYGGPRKRLHHLAFGAPGDEYEATRDAVRRAGVAEVYRPRGAADGGFWLRDPEGNLVNVRNEGRVLPPPDPPPALNSPGHITREVRRGCPEARRGASPRRLGPGLPVLGDPAPPADFYTRVLGMKLSDRCQTIIMFLRCTTDHHNLELLTSKSSRFHHAPFEFSCSDQNAM